MPHVRCQPSGLANAFSTCLFASAFTFAGNTSSLESHITRPRHRSSRAFFSMSLSSILLTKLTTGSDNPRAKTNTVGCWQASPGTMAPGCGPDLKVSPAVTKLATNRAAETPNPGIRDISHLARGLITLTHFHSSQRPGLCHGGSTMGTSSVAGATLRSFHPGNESMTLALPLPTFSGTRTEAQKRVAHSHPDRPIRRSDVRC